MLSIINKGLDITRANPLISKLSDDDKQIAKRVERYGTATVVNEHKITIDKKNKQMFSKYLEKQYSYTYNKRIVKIGDSTIDSRPYGYTALDDADTSHRAYNAKHSFGEALLIN